MRGARHVACAPALLKQQGYMNRRQPCRGVSCRNQCLEFLLLSGVAHALCLPSCWDSVVRAIFHLFLGEQGSGKAQAEVATVTAHMRLGAAMAGPPQLPGLVWWARHGLRQTGQHECTRVEQFIW